ncbi:hypothetical protein B0T16DRAFT_404728 [Cercophora newfieldiana]|uniref:trimethyllysine dioxygenase n=1 Tax=Cercophora newfieldiana TaxID=92897 RepID=A0AA39YIU5_9PEZI|nr:hypothetical protein B0T16DRAFT_404728 [Cercophora newfieldiana]
MLQIMNFSRCLARGTVLQRQLTRSVSTTAQNRVPPILNTGSRGSQATGINEIEADEQGISIRPAGIINHRKLPWIWLRDNCRCASCVNQDTQQRDVKTFEIEYPHDPKIKPLDVRQFNNEQRTVVVNWADGHESTYDPGFLTHYLNADSRPDSIPPPSSIEQWMASGPKEEPIVQYEDVMKSDEGVGRLTDLIRKKGFAFVDGTPYEDPEHTKNLLERIAFIRATHYGGFYDFTADLAMADTAYTNIALPAHTDTTYFDDPAGLQAFHMLSHEPDSTSSKSTDLGGESLLVDGFKAASLLREQSPEAYAILKTLRLPWHASGNKGIAITPELTYPVIETRPGDDGQLFRIRWNNDDRGVVPFHSEISTEAWYAAAKKWNSLLEAKEMQYWVKLQPGRTLIFDNWRVMHGRSAFTGKRRICGAYINRNDYISRWKTLNYSPEDVRRMNIGV